MTGPVWCAVVVSGLVLALAGCAGAEKAASSSTSSEVQGAPVTGTEQTLGAPPTETGTAGKGATARPGPPEMPAVAKTNTKEGAEAFAVWYFESLNYSMQHPEAGIPEVAESTCKTCSKYAENVAQLRDNKWRYSAPIFAPRVEGHATIHGRHIVNIDMTENPYDIVDAKGKKLHSESRHVVKYQPDLMWKDGAWKVAAIRADLHA